MRKRDADKALYGEGLLGQSLAPAQAGELRKKFQIPPFTIFSARDGVWQDRKRAWLSLGIQSELGRGEEDINHAAPGGSAMPAMDYKDRQRGTGSGKAIEGTSAIPKGHGVFVEEPEPARPLKVPPPAKVARKAPAPSPGKRRFAMPTMVINKEAGALARAPAIILRAAAEEDNDGSLMSFDELDWDQPEASYVGLDVETYINFFCINLTRFSNGKKRSFELSERSGIDFNVLQNILFKDGIVTFNGLSYDLPIIYIAMQGVGNAELKHASDVILRDRLKPWQVERQLGVKIPRRIRHIDLFDSNPSIRSGLKTLHGRLHGRKMMDLPYPPEARLTRPQMNVATLYCFNDIEATQKLFEAMREPLLLRRALTAEYGVDMMNKSDAQVGEAIIKTRVEKLTRRKIWRSEKIITEFDCTLPDFLIFENPRLAKLVEDLRDTRFYIGGGGKIATPKVLDGFQISIGSSTYSLGIGGIHSTEEHRAVHADDEWVMEDIDVASQYPKIIMKVGLYPEATGPEFLDVFGGLIVERLGAKDLAGELSKRVRAGEKELVLARDKAQAQADGGKIALNGIGGKLNSGYSPLYGPHVFISMTLTGQLSVLMLIEWFERAGAHVVSANTDGVVVRYRRSMKAEIDEMVGRWESNTNFKVERAEYKSIYNSSVNTYIAIKSDGKVKMKGYIANPWKENDLRAMMSKNPQMTICSDAILAFIESGTPFEETIRACRDPRAFVTIIKVEGGSLWRGRYLAKIVRYYWSTDGEIIVYASPGKSGLHKKVSNTDGAKPLMEMPDELPDDIDYERYVAAARAIAIDFAVIEDDNLWEKK